MSNESSKDGGPAFPVDPSTRVNAPGMSLRDWFAGMALQGSLANNDFTSAVAKAVPDAKKANESFAIGAYALADAMLKAREA